MIFVHVRPTITLKNLPLNPSPYQVGQINTSNVPRNVYMVCCRYSSRRVDSFIRPPGQSERLSVWVCPRVCRSPPESHFQPSSDALSFAIAPDPVFGLYTDNASAPLQAAAGLRQIYKFGIYSHCAYLNDTAGRCGNKTIGDQFKPYDAITSDMSANWSIFTQSFIPDSTFRDSKFLGHNSKAAYWMLLIGLLCAAAAFITYVA
jgi:hypothetical protein